MQMIPGPRGKSNIWKYARLGASSFRYLSAGKMLNFLNVQLDKRLNRLSTGSRPYIYFIDPGNICNLKCPLCRTGAGDTNGEAGAMSLEVFKHIFRQIEKDAIAIGLYNWGEPFLNPNIIEMIELASKSGIAVFLSTNLNIQNFNAEKVVNSGLSYIIISLDGYDQPSYAHYRKKGKIDLVLRNMRKLSDARGRGRLPFIEVQCLIHSKNENHLERIRKVAHGHGADFFRTQYMMTGQYTKIAEDLIPRTLKKWYRQQNYGNVKRPNCIWLYDIASIDPFGNLGLCCFIQRHDNGNVLETSFPVLWNSERFLKYRSRIYDPESDEGCASCPIPFHQNFQIRSFLSDGILKNG